MYPPILALHQDLGKLLMGTRKRTRAAAAINAKQYGYKGLKYALESRFTGK
jgi:trehalose/maltose hydrolase-like predicted phosphorylase